MKRTYIFVYGTLMRGYGNNVLLRHSKFVGLAKTINRFALYSWGVPFVTPFEKVSAIKGELYRVNIDTLKRIDQLESHPDWYKRFKIPIICKGKRHTAWLYFNPEIRGTLIKSGDYRNKVINQSYY